MNIQIRKIEITIPYATLLLDSETAIRRTMGKPNTIIKKAVLGKKTSNCIAMLHHTKKNSRITTNFIV
jgi:hypothetical protein